DVLRRGLGPSGKAKEVTAVGPGSADNPSQGRRPHRLEASGHVRARSPDMIIRDSDRLNTWFEDAVVVQGPPAQGPPPKEQPDARKSPEPARPDNQARP